MLQRRQVALRHSQGLASDMFWFNGVALLLAARAEAPPARADPQEDES